MHGILPVRLIHLYNSELQARMEVRCTCCMLHADGNLNLRQAVEARVHMRHDLLEKEVSLREKPHESS